MKRFYEFNDIAKFVFLGLAGFMLMWNIFAFFLVETEKQFDTGMFVMFALLLIGWACDLLSGTREERRERHNENWKGF